MMLVTNERYSYESLSKSQIPSLYSYVCKCRSNEISSGPLFNLVLVYDSKQSKIFVRIIARHYILSTDWFDRLNFITCLRAKSLFHYSTKRATRKIYDRQITIKSMYAKIGAVPLHFRGVKPAEDDYED